MAMTPTACADWRRSSPSLSAARFRSTRLTLHPVRSPNRGDLILQELADQTGGRLYIAPSSQDLGQAFAQIEQDLRAQYYVSFPPQARPGFHALRVEVQTPQKLEIHARQGYYALAP